MARGWESKAIEEQIDAAEAAKQRRAEPVPTPEELAREARRQSLLLSRARIVNQIEAARDARHRAQLELALAHLDAELRD